MIQGSTELVAIVGSPIAQVKSPENFNRWFADHQQNVAMLAIDLAPSALQNFIQTLRGWQNLRGCVVTVPYKQLLASRLDSISERSAALRSVNVIRREADGRLVGDIVDGEGFLSAARKHDFNAQDKQAMVIGTGGVGSAIAWSLCQAGVSHLAISDLSQQRVEMLGELLRGAFPKVVISANPASLEPFDLVVNASPVGMGAAPDDKAMPLPLALMQTLQTRTLVADVVTSPAVTSFLAFAQRLGCPIQTGPEMALAQLGNLGHFMGVTPLQI
ncbi:Shikimate dehydrogenase (NADP(+)) [Pseudomonas fluorescens]|uniref:Shikimate dehydrogenase (NADP(+)) n=1 Tax=Pseudomonas fluorescens TaxID=294 RepID=A0A5E7NLF1_PSEFL|nr:shikimate dehydrogenase [Pseudomonas fluorescens]VVM78662.1 Shikimate dehydrogenase (NADP(+)) [Pseudomonas fluorescens]VVP38108.1 Shikimate dehydrogenase (NADP(+)) [Pseudomonas fluorescens]